MNINFSDALFRLSIQFEYTQTQFKEGATDFNIHGRTPIIIYDKTHLILLCDIFQGKISKGMKRLLRLHGNLGHNHQNRLKINWGFKLVSQTGRVKLAFSLARSLRPIGNHQFDLRLHS